MTATSGPRNLPFYVGRYECLEFFGGGMADVYRARDTELPREVVIKILKRETMDDPESRRAFIDEVALACQCQHENIVTTYDKGDYEGLPYIVMELLRGENLSAMIRREGTVPVQAALKIAEQIARALQCVHSQGIIHRDLKPANVQFDAQGRAKLVDFGIAKMAEWNRTQAGFAKGTAHYMAPEQIMGKPVGYTADIWSFGVLCFELFAGQRPFHGAALSELWGAILNGLPDWSLLNAKNVPQPVQAIVRKCLEKDASARYQNFAEVLAALEAATAPAPVARPEPVTATVMVAQPVHAAPKSSSRAMLYGLLAVLLLVIGVGAWWMTRTPNADPSTSAIPPGMVLVPAGLAVMGADKHSTEVAAFYIDRTEVSNHQYQEFMRITGSPKPAKFPEDRPDYPVVNVSFEDAQAYARWAGKRLPYAAEWEKAARGTDGRSYPWGNEADRSRANVAVKEGVPGSIAPVGSYVQSASVYGALNLIGNVWEWVDSPLVPEPAVLKHLRQVPGLSRRLNDQDKYYAIRGGAFDETLSPELVYDAAPFPAKFGYANIGFRCAKTP